LNQKNQQLQQFIILIQAVEKAKAAPLYTHVSKYPERVSSNQSYIHVYWSEFVVIVDKIIICNINTIVTIY
jgi:hypothetical protein